MKISLRHAVHWLALFCFILWSGLSTAQQTEVEPQGIKNAAARLATWEADAAKVDATLSDRDIDPEIAGTLRATIEPQRANARDLAAAAKRELEPLLAEKEALGPEPEEGQSEADSVARERAVLQRRIDELKAIVSKADLAFTRADRLLTEIAEAQRARFTERLLTKGPTPLAPKHWVTTGESLLKTGLTVGSEAVASATDGKRSQIWRETGPLALTGLLFAIVLMVVARRWALRWLFAQLRLRDPKEVNAETDQAAFGGLSATETDVQPIVESGGLPLGVHGTSRGRRLLVGIGVTLTRLAIPLVAIIAAQQGLLALKVLGPTGEVILEGIARGAIVLSAAYALIYAFFAPFEPQLRLSLLNDRAASIAAWLSMIIALTLALNVAVVQVGETLGWPIETLAVLNLCILSLGAFSLWRLAHVTAPDEEHEETTDEGETPVDHGEKWLSGTAALNARRIAYAVSIVTPLLALAGYFALSRFIFFNVLTSAAVIGALVLIYSVAKEALSALSEASRGRRKGKKEEVEGEERLSLLPVFIGFVLTLVAIPVLALIWGATTNDLGEAYFALTNGITIGDTTFRPGDIVIAALVFGLGLFVTRTIQAIMRRTVMPRTRLDAGARSSIVAGLGYLGFFVSALVAISAAGLDLTNLAFLGAALGVGIGFGLQNIVNNFVSGIILLIERPIKVGDWIEVGGTHGTVEKVNVRSTEIKTFDKASYIVPNSDLISGAVMNMTHGDLLGRVIAPVGVAYGTDARKVEKILLEIARAHPMILRRPPPQVVFKQFGADSLDFELRGFLRDVNWILSTHSDINFEIDRRFREEGIEIPFAQRDLHLKSAGPLVEAMQSASAIPRKRPPSSTAAEPDSGE